MNKIITILFLSIFFINCTSPSYSSLKAEIEEMDRELKREMKLEVINEINLISVERPANISEKYGEVIITKFDSLNKKYLIYNDDLIEVLFLFREKYIGLVLHNKSDHSMKINWDNSAWISPEGTSQRVIHSGVKYSEKNSLQAPSIIIRKGKLKGQLTPADNIVYDDGWYVRPLWGYENYWKSSKRFKLAQQFVGKNCSILLPIQIEGIENEYIFNFEIGEPSIIPK